MYKTDWTTAFSHTGPSRDRGLAYVIPSIQNALFTSLTYLNRLLPTTKISAKVSDRPIMILQQLATSSTWYYLAHFFCCMFTFSLAENTEKSSDCVCPALHCTPNTEHKMQVILPEWMTQGTVMWTAARKKRGPSSVDLEGQPWNFIMKTKGIN